MATPTYKLLAIPTPPEVIIEPVEIEELSVVLAIFNVVPEAALVDKAVKTEFKG